MIVSRRLPTEVGGGGVYEEEEEEARQQKAIAMAAPVCSIHRR